MATAESDSENSLSDDMDEDLYDNTLDGMYDADDYDGYGDFCKFNGVSRLISLPDSILKEATPELPSVDISTNNSIHLAMNSKPDASNTSNLPKPFIDDSLRTYLTAIPLVRRTGDTEKPFLSIDPTIDEFQSQTLSIPELYVGNLRHDTKSLELKAWFIHHGYRVSHVDLRGNKISGRFALVRFDSISTAKDVLHKSETDASNFVFKGNKLDIKRKQQSKHQRTINSATTTQTNEKKPTGTSFEITDIYYGTLITGEAMRNLQRKNSIISNDDEFGIIAHHLINDDLKPSFHFNINTETKKLAIVAEFDKFEILETAMNDGLKFEWNFRDLKGKKVTPVLINQDENEIYLLIELKRPPIIFETQNINWMEFATPNEIRLPGTLLIGHSNAWLFRLSAEDPKVLRSDYMTLFRILHSHNLSPRQFSGENIIHLITTEPINKSVLSVQLISNEEWVKQNEDKVNDFFNRRWPSYPFETKFEIMKLISKHIITVIDLIVDEQAEDILKLCTINTLVALTDKIVEFAPRWFSATCDDEDEDENGENEQEQSAEPEEDSVPITTDDSTCSPHIRSSATGASINTANTDIASMTRNSLPSSKHHLGTFSRLLIYAHKQLVKNHQLCRSNTSGVYVTKLELRTGNVNSFLIRKIYITPSTVLYEGPYREETCTVTRHFEEHQDRFLRVTFRDEDYGVLHNSNDNVSKMYDRIKNILINGVNVCDRNYQFLAFSSSQLREHSCWMFAAPDNNTTVDTIREWMGDFREARPVAKYGARLGQLFSTSTKGIKLEKHQFKDISDKETYEVIHLHRRKHCFTDGIGIISTNFAKKLAEEMNLSDRTSEEMNLSDRTSYPSAFQIRCGGYKGMLCVDVFNRIKEPDKEVYFRSSMRKFEANDFSIDIVRTSLNPSVAFLNQQIILLLSSLGIPDQNFIDLQNHMLKQLKVLTEDPKEAIQSLKDLNEFGGNGFHGFLIAYIRKLDQFKDPFVWRLLRVFKTFLIKELRTKAKIRVQDSWCLLGVIDESGTLQYGQVFIQIDNSHDKQKNRKNPNEGIFEGPVVVTRNPCFHPGDIRKLEAVNIPAFHGLKNVIVFPMNGPRPHAAEMSGGDLDGDIFWISRHPKLIFEKNDEPFDYQGQEDEAKQTESSSSTKYTIKDVCKFFGEYIAADNLGQIANSHLVLADQSPQGAKDEKCLTLARMHSVAVDFAKNGVSAPPLTGNLRPKEYPSYMEKKDKPEYPSNTILGRLYDMIKLDNTDLYINEEKEINVTSSFPYKSFFIDGDVDYISDARIMKADYEGDVKRIMRQYGIKEEVEIVSGYVLKFTSKQYAQETKLFDLKNEITHAYKVIQDKYLRLFWEEFYRSTEEEIQWSKISKELTWKNQIDVFEFRTSQSSYEEVKKKASAWFRVTYEPWITHIKRFRKNQKKNQNMLRNSHQRENQQQQHERFNGLFSFAWLVYPVLLRIFDEREDNSNNNTGPRKKKKKNKKVLLNNDNGTI